MNKFDAGLLKKYPIELEEFNEDTWRSEENEEVQELYGFIDDVLVSYSSFALDHTDDAGMKEMRTEPVRLVRRDDAKIVGRRVKRLAKLRISFLAMKKMMRRRQRRVGHPECRRLRRRKKRRTMRMNWKVYWTSRVVAALSVRCVGALATVVGISSMHLYRTMGLY